eukprot:CAMPEP_0184344410 /NCGR_PEP_ID=MMETSP1089-20130417/12924_1 /TAXON_ID=38269 ORGANISM="Gloeochaete wittrockiana, Strain SAG46.84" /NCGR_SAMPLE_ID=MMETSP1089 /ASSEMBLY_ACC=CAM_ASM_000445 /LENGTH=143 /DNA_ID=CAMNT_0026674237 /DNA_START=134 /DNA_END=562 /DNA_ORIENTATION=+
MASQYWSNQSLSDSEESQGGDGDPGPGFYAVPTVRDRHGGFIPRAGPSHPKDSSPGPYNVAHTEVIPGGVIPRAEQQAGSGRNVMGVGPGSYDIPSQLGREGGVIPRAEQGMMKSAAGAGGPGDYELPDQRSREGGVIPRAEQ